MIEKNDVRIRGSNPSHYNHAPNAVLADDLATHLLKYYGHIVLTDKYSAFDNTILNYESIAQLSLPGNDFDLSLAEMGLKHTSFYNELMGYLRKNIYISTDDLKEYSDKSEVSIKIHEIVGKIKQTMEDLIKMANEDNSLTPFSALDAANKQMLKDLGFHLLQYENLIRNAQALSTMKLDNCNCTPQPTPDENNTTTNYESILAEIENLKTIKLDVEEANNKFATKESIPSISGLASETYVKEQIQQAQLEDKDIDLSGYALKNDTEKAINDAKEVLNASIENKIDKSVVESDYAKKEEIPDVSSFIIESKVDEKIAAIQIPSIENLATKDELNAKANSSDIPSIEGLAKSEEVISKTDYESDKATFALSANVISNETYTADKETFALKTALDELSTKYQDLVTRLEKLEKSSNTATDSSDNTNEEVQS